MKLLLINPRFPESFWSFSWALDKVTTDKKAVNSPLGLATLAALSPPDWDITLIDENVEPIDWSFQADIVGVCGMGVQVPRQKEILDHFRRKNAYVVAGGSYASLCPEDYAGYADTVVSGEAENIWPLFCADFEAGSPQKLYREEGSVDLALSPAPRYDLLKLDQYLKVSMQFSRGCPFRCEFCDIIVMFGRKPRTKPLTQIEKELDILRQNGVKSVFLVDDNLIGHLPKAKELLAFLADYQKRHDYRFTFGTEASVNMAQDAGLLSLFKKANFEWVFLGIETPNALGLKETQKTQNLRGDLLTAVRTIYSYGLEIYAGFIVGFDADDVTIFDRQFDFIVDSGITVSMVGLLSAIPKTPLHERLQRENRLRFVASPDNTRPATNVIPLKMSYEQLIEGYEKLHRRLTQEKVIFRRIANKLRFLKNPPNSPYLSGRQKVAYLFRLVVCGILPGGIRRIYYFARSCLAALLRPEGYAAVVTDWIAALSLKAFQARCFDKTPSRLELAYQRLSQVVAAKILKPGSIVLQIASLHDKTLPFGQGAGQIWIHLMDKLDSRVMPHLSRAIRGTLKKYQEAIVIDCRLLKESNSLELAALLRKLRRYRHQIHIRLSETLYESLHAELFPFQITLATN